MSAPNYDCVRAASSYKQAMDMTHASTNNRSFLPADIGFFLEPGFDGCEATAEVITLLLGKFPQRDRWCVEFGAGEDSHGSTTHRLIVGDGYSAVLIEGVPRKVEYNRALYKNNPKVLIIEKFVGMNATDENCLDKILAGTPAPTDLDFMSIDIDGNDYHVWNAITQYRAKLLMIEFNPTIPPEIKYVQPADANVSFGNSLAALIDLGKTKGYELVCVYGVNAFFVRREDFHLFGLQDNSIHALWTKRDCVTYLYAGYNGKIMLAGCQQIPWTYNIPIPESKVQVIPRFLQKGNFSRNDYRLFQLLCSPGTLAKKILRRIFKG
jgi:hypothetical protein